MKDLPNDAKNVTLQDKAAFKLTTCILSDTINVTSPTVLCKMFITVVLHFVDKRAIVTFYEYGHRSILQLYTMTAGRKKLTGGK